MTRLLPFLACAGAVVALAGCASEGADRLAVTGTVNFENKPLEHYCASGVVMGDAMAEILAGVPVPGPNGVISFNTGKTTYLGADPAGIPSSMTDFRSIILHEMTHVDMLVTTTQ